MPKKPINVPAHLEFVRERITDQNVEDIKTTIDYNAITYWGFTQNGDNGEYEVIDRNDDEDDAWNWDAYVVTDNEIRDAYIALLNNEPKLVGTQVHGYFVNSWLERTEEGGIDAGDIDAEAADVLIQVAIFGEVIYG